jgi:hypothetical protein
LTGWIEVVWIESWIRLRLWLRLTDRLAVITDRVIVECWRRGGAVCALDLSPRHHGR